MGGCTLGFKKSGGEDGYHCLISRVHWIIEVSSGEYSCEFWIYRAVGIRFRRLGLRGAMPYGRPSVGQSVESCDELVFESAGPRSCTASSVFVGGSGRLFFTMSVLLAAR